MVHMGSHFHPFTIIPIKYEICTSVEIISFVYPEIVQEGLISLAQLQAKGTTYNTAQLFRNVPSSILFKEIFTWCS